MPGFPTSIPTGTAPSRSPYPPATAVPACFLHLRQETDMSLLPFPQPVQPDTDAFTDFVVHAQLMLDPSTPESVRREAEPRLLARLPTLLALGVFDLFAIRDPALRNLVQDELASLRTRAG
jgi:hypothetical protein